MLQSDAVVVNVDHAIRASLLRVERSWLLVPVDKHSLTEGKVGESSGVCASCLVESTIQDVMVGVDDHVLKTYSAVRQIG